MGIPYSYTTHRHLGDHVIMTGVVRNIRLEHPEIQFAVPDYLPEVVQNNPDYTDGPIKRPLPERVTYGPVDAERHGWHGNCVEGFTMIMCDIMQLPRVPIRVHKPVLVLNDDELADAERWRDCILINANNQTCTVSKGNPYWQEVADALRKDWRVVQVGGAEARDVTRDLVGVEDMRGRTTIRQLFSMVYGCKMVLSPPSAISNVAGAWSKPQVVVNAGREADVLTRYENAVHVSRLHSCGWGKERGCVALWAGDRPRGCVYTRDIDGITYCECQINTTAQDILDAARSLI